jgi:hypothetical protein
MKNARDCDDNKKIEKIGATHRVWFFPDCNNALQMLFGGGQ